MTTRMLAAFVGFDAMRLMLGLPMRHHTRAQLLRRIKAA
jgi:hypothetical protein